MLPLYSTHTEFNIKQKKENKFFFFFFFFFFFNEEINKKNKKIRDFDFYLIENILFFIALPIEVQLMLRHGNTSLQKKKFKKKKKIKIIFRKIIF